MLLLRLRVNDDAPGSTSMARALIVSPLRMMTSLSRPVMVR
jgi:hypothetical protein